MYFAPLKALWNHRRWNETSPRPEVGRLSYLTNKGHDKSPRSTGNYSAGSLLSCACRDFLRETRSLKEGESTMACLCSCSSLYHPPKDPPEGRELDSAADFKSGNVFHHLVMPKSVSLDTKEESEYHYENADEEKQDGNEKPEGAKFDMVSAEGSSGEYSWKASKEVDSEREE